ncbi:PucR family transcriptional regulator [Streptomyces physcomitrii]|uniref:Regulatory protein n=1 Tax=Streptomyces albus (strain ATCC 21838 / DSM 41398 / FERM P-419 / JCM 4703 / NBRC 107858) TaxID=1081613 RepID=A0A0B5EYG9_STRA4|nr:regulatory protein [Streptomyces albus]AOU78673.1 regulatory protein [Streptomyces albus]AYN34412.1 regulatory protein [Streptomyces albus]
MTTTSRPVLPPGSVWGDVSAERVGQFVMHALAEAPALAEEILGAIRASYPQFHFEPDESGEPKALTAIRRAIELFVQQLLTDKRAPRADPELFQEFGRAEGLGGRSLDSLQALYRLGVRLAWRRLCDIGQRVEIPPQAMYDLADACYEYLDRLVEQSVRGYAEAAAQRAGERRRQQARLMELLLAPQHRDDPREALAERAARIGWQLPQTVAVGILVRPALGAVAPALGSDVLLDMECERPRFVVPDPELRGRGELLRRALAGWSGALGPPVATPSAAKSLHWAETALGLAGQGLLPGDELLHCTEHTEALVLLQPDALVEELSRRCLAPLGHHGRAHAGRLAQTLLAWLETRGGAPEIAARIGVHPQTVRYRMRQIRELWGAELDDPDRRFELELVLRAMRLRGALPAARGRGAP